MMMRLIIAPALLIAAIGDPIPTEIQLIGTVITGEPGQQRFDLVSIGVDKYNATASLFQPDNCSASSHGVNVADRVGIARQSGTWFRLSWWHLARYWRLDRIDIDTGACKSFTPASSKSLLYSTVTLAAASDDEITVVGYAQPTNSLSLGALLAVVIDAHTGHEKLATVVKLQSDSTHWNQGFFVAVSEGKIMLEASDDNSNATALYEAPILANQTKGKAVCPLVNDVSWQLDAKRQLLVGFGRESKQGIMSVHLLDLKTCQVISFSSPGVSYIGATESTLVDRTGENGGIIASIVEGGKRIVHCDYVLRLCSVQDIFVPFLPFPGILNAMFRRGSLLQKGYLHKLV